MGISWLSANGIQADEFKRVNQRSPSPMYPRDIVLLADTELIRNAAEWISEFSGRATGTPLAIGGKELLKQDGAHIVAVVGRKTPFKGFNPVTEIGPQGFVLQRVHDAKAGELLVCWSRDALGCRYGLIEILRRLRVEGKTLALDVERVVDRPQFPMRICYLNFAEHLQNAFNPNLLFDTQVNRWSDADWERFIDMISAFRFNVFEYWLVPTLFAPDALQGGKVATECAATLNRVTAYAKRRGVTVHPIFTINTVGADWHYHCPRDPKEKAELVALWDHWSKALKGIESIGFFPGDPGGCLRNGCTAETYVDLCLELAKVVRKNNSRLRIELGTWGEPFGGWGVELWKGDTQRAAQAMEYFLGQLPRFPKDTFTSINIGFSPDCLPNSHGGDGRPYAKRAARTHEVLTWDYSVTEGEGTVSPRCRVRRIFERRREELAAGCYSGGICYTMAPRLNAANIFACAEAWWNPDQNPDAVLHEFGWLVFGEGGAGIGPLLEEFEVIPGWGHYPAFEYSPKRLEENMAKLQSLLQQIPLSAESRVPLATPLAEYRSDLVFFADLFHQLAGSAMAYGELNTLGVAAGMAKPVSLDAALGRLAQTDDFPQRAELEKVAGRLRETDVRSLRQQYWKRVYGIYDQIARPADPRAERATDVLFRHFHAPLTVASKAQPKRKLSNDPK
jgi:hypothetical protein